MRRLGRGLLAVAAVVAVGTAVAGWVRDPAELTAREAVSATRAALDQARVDAVVDPDPVAQTYRASTRQRVEVWRVAATTPTGPVEVLLARAGGQPVSIDDRTPDGAAYVLSDGQYRAVAAAVEDPTLGDSVRLRVALTVGAVVALAVLGALAAVPRPGRRP